MWAGLLGSIIAPIVLCLPFLKAIYWFGDEGILLRGAAYMISGHRLYVDLFEFYPPLSFLITESWLYAFGQSFAAARWLAVTAIVGVSVFSYLACVVASENVVLSLAAVTAWLVASQGALTMVNHHWFATLFSMITAWALLAHLSSRASRRWPFIGGLAAGAAAMTTPTCGAFALMAGLFVLLSTRATRTQLLMYILSAAAAPALCLIYILINGDLIGAYQDIFVFSLHNYASIQHVKFGAGVDRRSMGVVSLFFIAIPLMLLTGWGRRGKPGEGLRRLGCVLFGLAGFLGCFPRPDAAHILLAAPLLLPLIAYCGVQIAAGWDKRVWIALSTVPVLICLLSAKSYLHDARQALATPITATPAGPVSLIGDPDGAQKIFRAVLQRPQVDRFFFYPYMPLIPFLLQRQHASKIDIFVPVYTPPAQYYDACLSIERNANWLVIDKLWASPAHWKQAFPAMRDSAPSETRAFEAALDRDFTPVIEAGRFELRGRRPSATDAPCKDIGLRSNRLANAR
jgi:hypothetical protein